MSRRLETAQHFADAHCDHTLIDVAVCGVDWVLLEAGTHDRSVRVATADLIEASDAAIADVCLE